jgi:hypothetical protein
MSGAYRVAVSGDYAYVADLPGLRIINIAKPDSLFEAGFCSTPAEAIGVAVSGDYAYVADFGSGLRVIDVSNPLSPSQAGFWVSGSSSLNLVLSGDHVYLVDREAGLKILQFYGAGIEETPTPGASRITPNATIVRGVLDLGAYSKQHSAYRAELLDISGRKAMSLKPGANDVSRVAPGVYFVEAAAGQPAARVVIQR